MHQNENDPARPPGRADLVVAGRPLTDLATTPGPVVTVLLAGRDEIPSRCAAIAGEIESHVPRDVPITDSELDRLRARLEDIASPSGDGASHVVVVGIDESFVVPLPDPLRHDVVRVGTVASLGTIVESVQLLGVRRIVLVEGPDQLHLVDPTGDAEVEVTGTIDVIADHIGSAPRVAVCGPTAAASSVADDLTAANPFVTVDVIEAESPTRDAEQLVRWAASGTAERITRDLAAFRAAAAAGLTVEHHEVVGALRIGNASHLLVHDDVADETRFEGDRLVDLAVATAIQEGVAITMIPAVDSTRGPRLGAVLRGSAGDRALGDDGAQVGGDANAPVGSGVDLDA